MYGFTVTDPTNDNEQKSALRASGLVTLQGAREPCDAGASFASGSSDGPHDGAKASAAGPARGRLPLGGKRKRVVPGE